MSITCEICRCILRNSHLSFPELSYALYATMQYAQRRLAYPFAIHLN